MWWRALGNMGVGIPLFLSWKVLVWWKGEYSGIKRLLCHSPSVAVTCKRQGVRTLPWSLEFVILNKSQARHNLTFKFSSKLKYLKIICSLLLRLYLARTIILKKKKRNKFKFRLQNRLKEYFETKSTKWSLWKTAFKKFILSILEYFVPYSPIGLKSMI